MLKDIWHGLKRRNDNEEKIYEARSTGKSFCDLSELDRRIATDKIMFHGAAASGCILPQTEMFAQVIAEEITTFILDFGYADYTLEEFLLALRINVTAGRIRNPMGEDLEQVQFSGTCINLMYLSKVFNNYRVLRTNLDSKLKNLIDGYE